MFTDSWELEPVERKKMYSHKYGHPSSMLCVYSKLSFLIVLGTQPMILYPLQQQPNNTCFIKYHQYFLVLKRTTLGLWSLFPLLDPPASCQTSSTSYPSFRQNLFLCSELSCDFHLLRTNSQSGELLQVCEVVRGISSSALTNIYEGIIEWIIWTCV